MFLTQDKNETSLLLLFNIDQVTLILLAPEFIMSCPFLYNVTLNQSDPSSSDSRQLHFLEAIVPSSFLYK